jgi:cell division septation protein DedD
MSDKDRFTFDDNNDFPEADLSSAFSDGEFEADNPAPGVQEEPEPVERQQSKDTDKSSGSGSSRTRILLVLLLLVVAGGAGAYYFMDLGGTAPVVPTVPVPAQKAQKSVALPPQPAQVPPAKVQPAAKPVSVAVPPPPPTQPATRPVAEEPSQPAPEQQVAVSKPEPAPVAKPVEPPAQEASAKPAVQMAAPAPKPQPAVQPVAQAKPEATVKPAQQTAEAMVAPTPKPMPTPEQTAAPKQVAGGGFALDAGSYLFESNRDSLIARIKKLGYKPLVTPVDAKLDMTRLRLGTYRKEEVQKALEFARSIEPGAYTAPAGDGYVIYAGTFLRQGTVDKLTKRFLAEGVKVYPEPVQVVRTLSRIRFGSFATRADATAAVNAAGKAGVKAVVVTAN